MSPTFEEQLLTNIKTRLPDLKAVLLEMDGSEDSGEDGVYRFYHHSYKVYYLQNLTTKAVNLLQALAPEYPLADMFKEIVEAGTNKRFSHDVNLRWSAETRPILEAYFHARHMVALAIKCSEMECPPQMILPLDWGTLLHLYSMR